MPTLTAVAKSLESLRPELARLLLPIQSERDYRFALEVAKEFWDSKEVSVQAFLSVLTERIQAYEATNYPVEDASAGEVLEFLMEQHGLNQEEVAQAIGVHQTTLSRILHEQRKPTREQVKKLAEFFKVSPMVFLA
jgi:HTH-type transcriptional regulator/antitoxin HigA